MSRAERCFWVLALGALLAGCSTHRTATLPGTDEALDGGESVEVGSTVRVTLRSGEVIAGVVAKVTDDELVFRRDGDLGSKARVVARDDIDRIEISRPRPVTTVGMLVFTGVLVILGLGVLLDVPLFHP